MSRHRAVRNLDIDDVLEEDEYNSEYDENEFDEEQLSNEDLDRLDDGLDYVYGVIGYDTFLTAREIKEALWNFYFDQEQTVDWALEKIAVQEKKEAKKAAVAAEKKKAVPEKKKVPQVKPPAPKQDDQVEFLTDDEATQEITSEMDAMGLTTPAAHKEPLAKIPASKRLNVVEEFEKRTGEKPKLNLVVIGHVDAGKSTLMGHFLYDLGQVNERTMRKFERDSQKIGKGSFAFAWVLDETGEERERGVTMDIATNYFETEHRAFTLLDAPGHRDFIPNMISGTAQADAAILVVDASTNAFESGFDAGGQTKEHAVLARSLGVQQLIVAINKLDMAEWSEARYEEIKQKLGTYLTQVGFKKTNVSFIPVSGLTGENLVKKSKESALLSWYKDGPSLMEQIDKFDSPTRLLDRPLRMRVTDFFKGGIGSSGGVSVAGNIESGHVQVGEQVMIVPGNELGYVKTMQVNEEVANWAAAGDSVLMTLVNLDIINLSQGCLLCSASNPVPITSTFEAQIVVFDIRIPITPGYPVVLHHGSLDEPASIVKLVEILDKSTGEVVKKNPRILSKGMTAKVHIKLSQHPIPLETFKDNKQLGRIMLRKDGETVAAGVVNKILSFGS
ncbi:P-loop containing nucleoside triphosphate hydrolase protein [Blakeslea trispora]|nr:P-loop containing nucleoside triphosphate hydrolase protein [Blakeslea trispora]